MKDCDDNNDSCWRAVEAVAKKWDRRGPGFFSLLTLMFIGLKLTDHIDWSWWWVLAPVWIKFALIVVLVGIVVLAKKRTGWKSSGET